MSGKPGLAAKSAKWLANMQRSPQLQELLDPAKNDEDAHRKGLLFNAIFDVLALMAAVGAVQFTLSDDHCLGMSKISILNFALYTTLIEEHITDHLSTYSRKRQKTRTEGKKSANTAPQTLFGITLEKLGFRPLGKQTALTGWIQNITNNPDKLYCPRIADSVIQEAQAEIEEKLTQKAKPYIVAGGPYLVADFEDAGSASEKPKGVFTTPSGRTAFSMSSGLTEHELRTASDALERATNLYKTSTDKRKFCEARFQAIHSDFLLRRNEVPERNFTLWTNGTPEHEVLHSTCAFCGQTHFIGEPALHFKAWTQGVFINPGLDQWTRQDTAAYCKWLKCPRQPKS